MDPRIKSGDDVERYGAEPLTDTEFASLIARLAPFGSPPKLGLAVSGGADSMAMAVLAADWAKSQGGAAIAFIVDHGLRPGSAQEAATAAAALRRLGIAATILTLTDLDARSAMPARARMARFAAIEAACMDAGIIDLLLAHHAADQAETVIMRSLRGSGPAGLAGMAAVSETARLRILRPLLTVAAGRLRATLDARGVGWAEDPTNVDGRFTRARLRAARGDRQGDGPATRALSAAACADGRARAAGEAAAANWIAAHATIRPEGFALLPRCPWPIDALAAVLRMISGAQHLPATDALTPVIADPAGAIGGGICIAGVRLLPAGRLGPGFLLCREAAAIAGPMAATSAANWDGRFRRPGTCPALPDETIAALGADAARLRDWSTLPSVVLESLPAYRSAEWTLIAVPSLGWPTPEMVVPRRMLFHPARPAAGATFAAS
jgi:tRNA(Ile)-lysidine synthase